MNKVEFISRLSNALSHLPPQEREDILNDYEEHFRISAEMGNTEEQTAQGLGSPEELGATYAEGDALERPFEVPQIPAAQPDQRPAAASFSETGFPFETEQKPAKAANPFESPNYPEPPRAPQPEDYGDPWVQEGVFQAAPEPPSAQQVPPQGYGYSQQGIPPTGYPGADHESTGYYDSQGYFHPDGEAAAQPQTAVYAPYPSRSQGEQIFFTVLLIFLTVFLVLPVGGGLAVVLWGVIFSVAIAAGCVAVALFLVHFFNVGLALLGGAALCLCVALFLALISYTAGVVKLAISYFKMCGRVISGQKEAAI